MEIKTPTVGMGVTLQYPNDCYPYTVVEIITAKKIVVQQDEAKRLDDRGVYTENQEYEYKPDPGGSKTTISLRNNGKWCRIGSSKNSCGFILGHRRYYRDPHI